MADTTSKSRRHLPDRPAFYDTITTINARDYSPEQIQAWIARAVDWERWSASIHEQYFLVALEVETNTGIAALPKDGYLDLLYVHCDFLGQGTAGKLFPETEKEAGRIRKMYSDVSITARPFFEIRGYLVREVLQNVAFINYRMTKPLQKPAG